MSIEEIPILEMEVEDKLEVEPELEKREKPEAKREKPEAKREKPEAKKRGRPKGVVKKKSPKKKKVESESE
jgi:hypothetical protein